MAPLIVPNQRFPSLSLKLAFPLFSIPTKPSYFPKLSIEITSPELLKDILSTPFCVPAQMLPSSSQRMEYILSDANPLSASITIKLLPSNFRSPSVKVANQILPLLSSVACNI